MFSGEKEPDRGLNRAIDEALEELSVYGVTTEEYGKIMDQLVKLHKMKQEEMSSSVSSDTLALIAANLVGIFMIIKHERANIITSKAMNLVLKPR